MTREMSVAGVFYPATSAEVISSFNYFNDLISQQFNDSLYNEDVKALIVPHAGYVYSGFTANLAFRNVNKMPKRVVVIGPSHRVGFYGVSMNMYSSYETPFGDIKADIEFKKNLKSRFEFVSVEHAEHSTEVQFPFIKHYFPKATLIECVYGQNANLDNLIETILKEENTLLVISTDLSHFYDQDKANTLDKYCIEGIENIDVDILQKGEACGMQGVVALLHVVKKMSLHVKSIDYRTSGDITNDMKRVVGYYSAIVY
ncbi:AmmeMemoRadiSam system protein B [Sulfurospirillum arcachonense]|uniref:AmmeMemoRadiSam system protein B n=1 Tax=Sulfurospirillum arcachonense TaxID=57666 RepID=UPI0004AFCAB3|nr:AmmeMemoRadiSam system protein B [Sulfurospirillum arcachonense]